MNLNQKLKRNLEIKLQNSWLIEIQDQERRRNKIVIYNNLEENEGISSEDRNKKNQKLIDHIPEAEMVRMVKPRNDRTTNK